MDGQRGEWYLAKQIAVGILIAAAVIFIGFHLYAALVVQAVSTAANEATKEFQAQMQQSQNETRARTDAQRARTEAQRRQAEQDALQRRQQMARQVQAAADQAKADAASAVAREQAWHRFYKPSTKCDAPPDWDTQVECGNAFVRAKREFEVKWARGELR